MARQLQLRRGNLSNWTTTNPVLANGEFVLVSTKNDSVWNAYKIGNGSAAFNSLPIYEYTGVLGYGSPQGVYATSAALIADNPNHMYIYIVQADGNWWYWNVAAGDWAAGGLYQTPLSVVQTSGQSEIDVISQKAVTDLLSKKAGVEVVAKNASDIRTLENVINSANINQETTATATGVDTVALPKTAANTGMSVQLFGQSAENLVVNGDFRDGTTGWYADVSANSASNGVLTNTANGTQLYGSISTLLSKDIIGSSKYYTTAKVRVTNSNCNLIDFYINDGTRLQLPGAVSPVQNKWYHLSGIVTSQTSPTNKAIILVQTYPDAATAAGKVMEAQDVMCVNLTALGLDSLTKEQCDILFANYFEGSDNVLGTGRVRSVGKNLIDVDKIKSESYISVQKIQNGIRLSGFYGTPALPLKIPKGTVVVANWNTTVISGTVNPVWAIRYKDGTFGYYGNGDAVTLTDDTEEFTLFVELAGLPAVAEYTNIQLERSSAATAYEPYRESILQLTTSELRSNGLIKDEIRKGTNGYELVKRVGVSETVNEGVENIPQPLNFTSGWDTTAVTTIDSATQFTTTSGGGILLLGGLPGLNKNVIVRIKGIVTEGSLSIRNSSDTTGQFVLSGAFDVVYISNYGTAVQLYLATSSSCTVNIEKLSIKAIDGLSNLITPSKALELGSNVHYTLATPTITPIAHAGLLNSNSNGTAYFEPIIADAGVYSTNLTVQLTDYPIASFESIRKYANGTYTELSTATAVIAGDGLSFTHPDLNPGDLVMFTYAYNKESIGRSMTLTHYDSRFVEADTANGKVYRIVPVVTNGVVSWTAVEL